MKLVVQADDYAMTDAIAEGILKCARDGILTQTGLMTNGPHAAYYAKRMIDECPHVALGQEINLVSGTPLSDPASIPTLVGDDGRLLRSVEHKKIDVTDPDHVSYGDAYKEIKAQIDMFLEIVGSKPCFIGLHSYQNKNMLAALADLAEEYQIDDSFDIAKKLGYPMPQMGPWYTLRPGVDNADDYHLQLSYDAVKMFLDGECHYITDHVNEDRVCMLHTHAGFVDRDVLKMSTLTMTRLVELDLLCDNKIKEWIFDNKVTLTNFKELKREGLL